MNDEHSDPNWHRLVAELPEFVRPAHWPEREPLVRVIAWTLLSNHFHLLLQEIKEGCTAKFMQRLGGSMSMCFNQKYKSKGSLFQSSYHARIVEGNGHLNYLAFYILIKNVLEMYPGGLDAAFASFDAAWLWAKEYPYSSLRDVISRTASPIITDTDNLMENVIGHGNSYKYEAKELLRVHMVSRGSEYKSIMLEPW